MTIKTDIQRQVSKDRRRARNKRYTDKKNKKIDKNSTMYKLVKKREKEEKEQALLDKERREIADKVKQMREEFIPLKVDTL